LNKPSAASTNPIKKSMRISGFSLVSLKLESYIIGVHDRDLFMRVAGYSDYIHDLGKTLQDEIIIRIEHQGV